jgi:competence protein ComEA
LAKGKFTAIKSNVQNMQPFRKTTQQLTNVAEQRLCKILESRSEVAAPNEPAQILVQPPREAINPLIKIIAIAVCVVALLVWLNRPTTLTDSSVKSPGIPIAQPITTSNQTLTAQNSLGQIVIDVKGDVALPGLVTLSAGSRVADAIAAAGGLVLNADISTINLAERLSDGQMIYIGKALSSGIGADSRVNLNSATVAQLDSLPGVGPVMAGRIVAWRDQNQRFHSVEQLQEVPGIGSKVFANLKPLIKI